MSESNSDSPGAASRGTLKLKGAMRKAPPPTKPAPASQPPKQAAHKSGAAWSDEYKAKMQADMDALATR